MSTRSVVCSTVATLALLSFEYALFADTPALGAPTPIEQALIENSCTTALPQGALDSESYRECLKARLSSLRAAFGRDLEQLSRAERNQLDSTCSSLSASGREAYLNCLDGELTALLERRRATVPEGADGAAVPMPISTSSVLRLPVPPPPDLSYFSNGLFAGVALGLLIVVAGGAGFVLKPRTAQHACRQCGASLPAAGDLCASCRHEAAEARRRAAVEQRVASTTGDENAPPVPAEHAAPLEPIGRPHATLETQLSLIDQTDAEAGLPSPVDTLSLDAGPSVEAHQPIPLERRVEEAQPQDAEPIPSRIQEAVFDPYVVLGVMPGASREEITAAYEDAKIKFDPSLVSHLGYDVQKHFKVKAKALDRAYQLLLA